MKIAVIGTGGQLGTELQDIAAKRTDITWVFAGLEVVDLSKPETISAFVTHEKPSVVINAGAYTAVDKAETDQALALQINGHAVGTLAKACSEVGAKLIHISTDYVFNGNNTTPYLTTQTTDPVNYYGYSKMIGEQQALAAHATGTAIIRTSWVYSFYGNNFVKTMLRLMGERESLNVVADQQGCPTYAADLAEACVAIATADSFVAGIFHYSNSGAITWHTFAATIGALAGKKCTVHPVPTTAYPTPAKRPAYSVMDLTAITAAYPTVKVYAWEDSLKRCLQQLGALA
jgi:dTDP-4-dehydrorhamnose reductase